MWHDVRALNAAASALVALAVLSCMAAGMWWVSQRPMFTVRQIRIESIDDVELKHVNHLTVRDGALARITGNFFTVNLEQVRTAFESVPWVRRASVRREWPDLLVVSLEEHEALGTWGQDGRLISTKGDIFTVNLAEADEDNILPEFAGPDGSEKEVVARFKELHAWFARIQLQPLELNLSSRYAWTVRLNNGMSVALGREQDQSTLRTRVERLVAIYPQLTSRLPRIDTVDMRYPNGLALTAAGLKIPDDTKPAKAVAKKPNSSHKTNTKHT
ncbi:MAG: cell division protein FtsQ/DivIB [Pseudomonadota bacterium]